VDSVSAISVHRKVDGVLPSSGPIPDFRPIKIAAGVGWPPKAFKNPGLSVVRGTKLAD